MRLIRVAAHITAVVAAGLALLIGTPGTTTAPPTVLVSPAADDTTTSWSVVPGDTTGAPDGRHWVELTLGPGDSVTEHMVITNHGTGPVQFQLTAADGYFTDTGRFTMLPADRASTDAGTWIAIQPTVELQGGETRSVPFTVTVPDNATPGDHPAGVAAGILTGAAGQVGVDSRVGFRVMTRVTGALTPQTRTTTEAHFSQSWNPFTPGTLTITYTITNTGNTRLSAAPVVEVSGPAGLLSRSVTGDPVTEMAPGESRTGTITTRWWPSVTASVEISAHPAVVPADGTTTAVDQSTATGTTLTLPIGQAVVAVGLALVVALWTRDRRARRRRIEALVAAAREEGRRDGASLGGAMGGSADDPTG